MPEPLISVVMPVHNALPFLDESIESVVNQTLADFEFVILNDASTDGSEEVLLEWEQKDPRIRVYQNLQRLGLSGSSNSIVERASAPLIARMDADDVCAPERLERQWEVMRENPEIAVVGTLCDGINARGRCVRSRDRWRILRRSSFPPFPHGSVMFRRRIFDEVGKYREEYEGHEDQDLFRRMATRGRVVTLPEILYHYRYHLRNASVINNLSSPGESDVSYAQYLSALRSLGSLRLWAGHPPAILSAVIDDTNANWTFQRLMIAGWALWGHLHPESLRSFSSLLVRARDFIASVRVSEGRFYEWRFE